MDRDAQLLSALRALRDGNFSERIPLHGESDEVADCFNEVAEMMDSMRMQFAAMEEASSWKICDKQDIPEHVIIRTADGEVAKGGWEECSRTVNGLATDLTQITSQVLIIFPLFCFSFASVYFAVASFVCVLVVCFVGCFIFALTLPRKRKNGTA